MDHPFFLGEGGRAVGLMIEQNLILDHDVCYNCHIYASFHKHKDQCRTAAEVGCIRPKNCHSKGRVPKKKLEFSNILEDPFRLPQKLEFFFYLLLNEVGNVGDPTPLLGLSNFFFLFLNPFL